MNRIRSFFSPIWDELINKVTWPTWEELQNSTVIVLISAVILGIVIFIIDMICGTTLGLIYKAF